MDSKHTQFLLLVIALAVAACGGGTSDDGDGTTDEGALQIDPNAEEAPPGTEGAICAGPDYCNRGLVCAKASPTATRGTCEKPPPATAAR